MLCDTICEHYLLLLLHRAEWRGSQRALHFGLHKDMLKSHMNAQERAWYSRQKPLEARAVGIMMLQLKSHQSRIGCATSSIMAINDNINALGVMSSVQEWAN